MATVPKAGSSSPFVGLDAALQCAPLDVIKPLMRKPKSKKSSNRRSTDTAAWTCQASFLNSCKDHQMSDAQKITELSIQAKSTEPSIAIVRVTTHEAEMKFEISQDLAHRICTDLERFLTR
jgi:hypothetical protein